MEAGFLFACGKVYHRRAHLFLSFVHLTDTYGTFHARNTVFNVLPISNIERTSVILASGRSPRLVLFTATRGLTITVGALSATSCASTRRIGHRNGKRWERGHMILLLATMDQRTGQVEKSTKYLPEEEDDVNPFMHAWNDGAVGELDPDTVQKARAIQVEFHRKKEL